MSPYLLAVSAVLLSISGEAYAQGTKAPQPGRGMIETFPDCKWGEIKGSGISLYSFACPNHKLVADATLPGFVIEGSHEGETYRKPTIRVFVKKANAPLNSIMPQVRKASEIAKTDTCAIIPMLGRKGLHTLIPTGKTKIAYKAFLARQGRRAFNAMWVTGPI